MLVARIGGFQRQRLRLYAEHDRQDFRERDVVGVRPLVIAPAHMHPHFVGGHVRQRVIERLDMKLRALEEFGFRQILERGVPRHGEIGAIDLQHKAGRNDRLVFLAHRCGDGFDIGLVRRIILIGQKARDHAGRGGIEKRIGRTGGRLRPLHVRQIAFERGAIAHGDRPDAGHPFETPLAVQHGHLGAQVRERLQIEMRLGQLGGPLLGKAAEPVLHVGRIADLAGLAVADRVDADIDLPLHDIGDRLLHGAIEHGRVEGHAVFALLQKRNDRVAARQTADVRRQNSFLARLHPSPDCYSGLRRSSGRNCWSMTAFQSTGPLDSPISSSPSDIFLSASLSKPPGDHSPL